VIDILTGANHQVEHATPMSMQTIATDPNRRRSSRYVGHYGASQYRIDAEDRVIG